MKKISTLFFCSLVGLSLQAQRLFVEDFNYAAGQLSDASGGTNVSNGNWISYSGNGNYIMVGEGNLTNPGYHTSPGETSRSITIKDFPTSSEDVYRQFPTQTSGTIYCSFLLNVLKTDNLSFNNTSGEYFVTFLPSTSIMDFRGRVAIRQGVAANTFNIGVNTTSTAANNPTIFAPEDLNINQVHLITIAYQFVAGANNDVSKIWIDKPVSTTEPTPSATAVFPASGSSEFPDLARLVIRQAAFNTPNAQIDAIVVATSYAASLPLNLTSISGSLINKAAVINWTTENEQNVKGFAVEKGLNGTDFSEIAFVNANNTVARNSYSYEDNSVKGGSNYYRLRLVDLDGSTRFSQVVLVNNNATLAAQVFPNPASSNLNVTHAKAARGSVLKVVSLDGRLLKVIPVQTGATQTGISIADLNRGNYTLVFDNVTGRSATQFSKQ